ncbi:MAG: hypothetical protein U9Q82_05655 [Chloroflexota bacterium]|nr:hypothetical protein [Chloroflexota bacterium]
MVKLWKSLWLITRLTFITLVVLILLQRSVMETGDKTEQVRAFTREIEFNYIDWTVNAAQIKLGQISLGAAGYLPPDSKRQIVLDYLDIVEQIYRQEWYLDEYYADPDIVDPEAASQLVREELDRLYTQRSHIAPLAESILQNQLSATAAVLGLTLGGQPIPPLLYHITPLPHALIVSPRDTIRQDADISISPNITTDQRAALEEQVDQALDVSSLVVNIGGMGIYPTMVMQTTNINWMAEVISHEWTHNFLTLRPLGANYYSSPELRVINETTANIVGKAVGAALIENYYPEFAPPPPSDEGEDGEDGEDKETTPEPPAFDFRTEMHATRLTVDEMLTEGEIEAAEAYMESRRQFFWENGYHIRKLNQAYFAFHGAYADQPDGADGEGGAGGASGAAGEVEAPIGAAVCQLRAQSPSLAAFLNRISWIWSYQQLQTLVESSR